MRRIAGLQPGIRARTFRGKGGCPWQDPTVSDAQPRAESQAENRTKPAVTDEQAEPTESMLEQPAPRLANEIAVDAPPAPVPGPPVIEPPRTVPAGPTPPKKGPTQTAPTDANVPPGDAAPPISPEIMPQDAPTPGGTGETRSAKIQPVEPPDAAETLPVASNQPPESGSVPGTAESSTASGKVGLATPAPGKVLSGGKGDARPKFDPIKENGAHFVDWPKPDLAIIASGCLNGYLEPCGCAGMESMKGGLMRRYSFMEGLRKEGWNTVAIDVGGIPKRFGPQAVCKYRVAYESYRKMGYSALGLGVTDLRLPVGELISVEGDKPLLTCANVAFYDQSYEIPKRFQIIETGGYRIGVTAVLNEDQCKLLHNGDLQCLPLAEALRKVLAEFKKEDCNLAVLLAYGPKKWASDLAEQFPQFRFVITSDGASEPPPKPAVLGDGRYSIEVGEKGMYVSVLGIYRNDPQVRYQRVTLDSRYTSAEEIKDLMRQYQTELKLRGLEGLGVKPKSHPFADRNGDYVGSEKCESCHEDSYRIWKKSKHAHAWRSLQNHNDEDYPKSDPARTHDPECISCHVVGWHPTEFFPYKTGYWSEEKTPHLLNVGCESCHGPGGEHVKAEMGSDTARQEAAYKAVRVTLEEAKGVTAKACYNCHDLDNSPDFNFDTYWPLVEHKETE